LLFARKSAAKVRIILHSSHFIFHFFAHSALKNEEKTEETAHFHIPLCTFNAFFENILALFGDKLVTLPPKRQSVPTQPPLLQLVHIIIYREHSSSLFMYSKRDRKSFINNLKTKDYV
jgi:hypothetical protein